MKESLLKPQTRIKRIPYRIIFWTAVLTGTLDIAAAFINSYFRSGTNPVVVLQFIASGLLGTGAFNGGLSTALLGLIFHFLIAFIWTLIFFILFPKMNFPPRYMLISGLSYGIIIWIVMNLIVLPLSNAPPVPFKLMQTIIGIGFIMFLIGLPISVVYHKFYKNN